MRKPAVSKLYHVRAFEVATDRVYEFDVQGLNNLPAELAILASPKSAHEVPLWEGRLPALRNSLSYHNGRHGVVSMGPFRVYAERDASAAPHEFIADVKLYAGHELDAWDDRGPIHSLIYTFPLPFRELMAQVVADIRTHLHDITSLRPNDFAGRVRVNAGAGKGPTKLYFSAAGKKYMANVKVSRHDAGAV